MIEAVTFKLPTANIKVFKNACTETLRSFLYFQIEYISENTRCKWLTNKNTHNRGQQFN